MWHKVKQEPLTSLNGVGALRRLTGQHDTVRTIEDGVGDVADFSARRPWVDGHGLWLGFSIS